MLHTLPVGKRSTPLVSYIAAIFRSSMSLAFSRSGFFCHSMVRDLLKVFNYAIDYAKYNNIDILNFSTYAIFNLSNRDDFNNYAVFTELMIWNI